MADQTQPHTTSLLEPNEYSEFMLRAPKEILVVLRGLLEHVSQITVYFNEGKTCS